MCVLPNNIVHQKFYLFLWFWLFAIAIITLLHQIYRSTSYHIGSKYVPRVDICRDQRSQKEFPGGVFISENNTKFIVFYVTFCVISCALCIYASVANYAFFASKIGVADFWTNIKPVCSITCCAGSACCVCLHSESLLPKLGRHVRISHNQNH